MINFNENPNVAVFTTRFVIKNNEPIHNVFHHEEDGAWEFTGHIQATEDGDYLIVALHEIIKLDPSVLRIADLKLGEGAFRPSIEEEWERYKL